MGSSNIKKTVAVWVEDHLLSMLMMDYPMIREKERRSKQ